jgi:LPS O-antigen subunit length determinant protein (WzzB/FepE family)
MKIKPNLRDDDEIDLIALFRIIWNGKLKIVLITIVSFLIGSLYAYQASGDSENTVVIKPATNSEFIKISSVYKYLEKLEEDPQKIIIYPQSSSNYETEIKKKIFNKFFDELMDYEEIMIILGDKNIIKDKISNLSTDEKKKLLYQYAKSLKIVKSSKPDDYIILNLNWDIKKDKIEAIDILEKTIDLTSRNLKTQIHKELNHKIEQIKNQFLISDMKRVEYLLEQSLIAKELGISDNLIDFQQSDKKIILDNFYTKESNNFFYYLKGYNTIQKEIEIIKKRKYTNIDFVVKEINLLKENNFNLIDYNISFVETKLLKNVNHIQIISVLFGLIVGIFYIAILHVSQSQTVFAKRK